MIQTSNKKLSRSRKLRKYASVYKSHIRKTEQISNPKSPRRPRNIKEKKIIKKDRPSRKDTATPSKKIKSPKKEKKKPLNPWQKFVQIESKKSKYQSLPGKERLSLIAADWKNKQKFQ